MAIVDGVALARHLRTNPDIPAALLAYERERIALTEKITNFSWRLGAVGQWHNPVACVLRDVAMSLVPKGRFSRATSRS